LLQRGQIGQVHRVLALRSDAMARKKPERCWRWTDSTT
jgi:hypothetical protein